MRELKAQEQAVRGKNMQKTSGSCPFCGFDPSAYRQNPRCLPINTVLAGKYLVGKVLGEGGFGITYMGYDLNMKTRIAIKEYFPVELVSRDTTRLSEGGGSDRVISLSGEKSKTYRQGLQKYVDEARSVSRFSGTPGIVSVKDFFYENDTAYIVMEYIEGVSLKEYLKQRGGRLPEEEALAILRPVLEALEQVHGAGIVHRDISPDNIMLTFEGEDGSSGESGGSGIAPVSGQAKAAQSAGRTSAGGSGTETVHGSIAAVRLIDFGAARMTAKNDQKSLTIILKHGYAPEEQYRSHGEQGPWTDVYALCAVLYRMLTGTVPEPAMDRLFSDDLKRPEELGAVVSPAVSEAVMKGLAVKKDDRIRTVRELSDALYAGKRLKNNRSEKRGRIRAATLAAACLVGIAIAGAGILFTAERLKSPDAAKRAAGQNEAANPTESGESLKEGRTDQPAAAQAGADFGGEAGEDGAEVSLTLEENAHNPGEQIVWPRAETMIAGGENHLLSLRDDGTVLAAGNNSFGQCDVGEWKDVAAVYASNTFSAGLCTDGTVLVAGSDTLAQAVSSWQGVTMLALGNSHILGLTQDGRVLSAGTNTDGCCETGDWEDIQSVWAGNYVSFGITSGGKVKTAGRLSSDLTDEEEARERIGTWSGIRQIVDYMGYLYGLTDEGAVLCAGRAVEQNEESIRSWNNICRLQAGDGFVAGLQADGTLVALAGSINDQTEETAGWKDVAAISSTMYNLIGLKRDGSIVVTEPCKGGSSTLEEILSLTDAVQAVWLDDSLIVLRANGKVCNTGFVKYYENELADLSGWNDVVQLAANSDTAAGLCADGHVVYSKRAGVSIPNELVEEFGREGAADLAWERKELTPDLISGWRNVQAISLSADHAAALLLDKTAAAAGFPERQDLVDYHTGLTANGSCQVEGWAELKQVLALNGETVGLKEDGTLTTTREMPEEWAGYTDIESIWGNATFRTAAAIRSDGSVVYLYRGSDAYGQNNVNGWTDMVQLSVGRKHAVGLRADGTVAAVGDNFAGQCEVEEWSGIVSVAAGDSGTVGITDQGNVLLAGTLPNDFFVAESWPAVTVPDGR